MSDESNKEPLPIDDVIMSEAQCAYLIGVATETLMRWRRNGEGPPYFAVTSVIVRYSRMRTLEWLQQREVQGSVVKKVETEQKP